MERQLLNQDRADYVLYNASKVYNTNPLLKTKKRYAVWCRIAISRILRNEGNTLNSIGAFIKKDHPTVLHYLKSHDDFLKYDKEYKMLFTKFEIVLGNQNNSQDFLLNIISERVHYSIETLQALSYDWDFIENYIKECINTSKTKLLNHA